MHITYQQAVRIDLVLGTRHRYLDEAELNSEHTAQTILSRLKAMNDRMTGVLKAGWLGYRQGRHLAIKALIKELETGEPVTDPMVEVATKKLERIGDSIFMRKVK